MFPTPLKTFTHPQSVYKLDYPAHWDQVQEKNGESCGFGPHERDDVGLWISIMPMSLDTDRIAKDLPKLMEKSLEKCEAKDLRPDPTLRHYGLVADVTKEGEGGHYWLVAGGDVVLFASSQVPAAERDVWNPAFQRVLASLHITRDEELLLRQITNDVLAELRRLNPDQEFECEADHIRGPNQVVYLGNLFREVRAAPERRTKIIKNFVKTLSQSPMAEFGHEVWEEIKDSVLPVLKPRDYVEREGPTQHLLTKEWLDDVVICYVIKRSKMFRFVTGWDVRRWGLADQALEEQALANLAQLPWPREMVGSRVGAGRLIIVDTDDNLASSRLLHPDLYRLFSGPLGTPFWGAVPCRDRLVLYSDRREIKQRIGRRVKKDHDASAYPITPRPFLVTRDGIAPATK